jgi:hypothetical protein
LTRVGLAALSEFVFIYPRVAACGLTLGYQALAPMGLLKEVVLMLLGNFRHNC